MKYYKILIILCAIALTYLISSCSDDNINYLSATSARENELLINCDNQKINLSDNPEIKYYVTKEDAENFAKALRKGMHFKMDVYTIDKDTLLYLVNYEKGWVIIAGDKRVNPFVAESEEGEISLNLPNKNLLTWIDSYADEIRVVKRENKEIENEYTKFWTIISPQKIKTHTNTRYSDEDCKWAVVSNSYCDSQTYEVLVPHLTTTLWGQESPWNSKLPLDTSCGNLRCPTGCTAVAFAQLVYYMHYHLGKPNWLYHNISVSKSTISGQTQNIGFNRSSYVSNSDHWDDMPLTKYNAHTSYVGDLMLDIGNRLNMSYSGSGSGAWLSASCAANYGLTYKHSDYNYQYVKNDLQNSKPVNIVAFTSDNGGHTWLIDGIGKITRHYIRVKHFEFTENWMFESEYYDTFDELRQHYHINSEFDIIEEDGGDYTTEYLFMNWGYNGDDNGGYYSTYPSSTWSGGGHNFKYNKTIDYDFK